MPSPDESVRVVVQARPLLPGETAPVVALDGDTVRLAKAPGGVDCGHGTVGAAFDEFGPFTEARLAGGEDGIQRLYDAHLAGLLAGVFDGLNSTVLAYGQTASGKTFSMDRVFDLVAQNCFEIAKAKSAERNLTVRVGVVEIYQENIRDLVDASERRNKGGAVRVSVRNRRNGTVFLDGAKEVVVRNAFELQRLVARASRSRQTAATGMNAVSSRSHSIITISVQQEPFEGAAPPAPGAPGFLSAKLHLVDLAGSERTKRCTADGGARFAEGVSINTGLLSLAKVISALADRASHVPYRESNLTRLLQDSLGGNSRSLVLACISPTELSREETASTLRYAMRIKNIRNKPRVNIDPASVEISDLRAALARAKAEVARLRNENDVLRGGPRGSPRGSPRASPKMSPKARVVPTNAMPPVPALRLGAVADSLCKHPRAARRKVPPTAATKPAGDDKLLGAATPARRRWAKCASVGNVHRMRSAPSPAVADDAPRRKPVSPSSPASPPVAKAVPIASPGAVMHVTSAAIAVPVVKDDGSGSSTRASPGTLMGRLKELEIMLQTTPTRDRSNERPRSLSPDRSPSKQRRRISSAGRARSSSPSFAMDADDADDADAAGHVDGGGQAAGLTEQEARMRAIFVDKLAKVSMAKAVAESTVLELRDELANIAGKKAAEAAVCEADHQSCIAELRSLLAETQKRENLLKQKANTITERIEKQRLLRRVKSAERMAAAANSKLADNAGKSDLSRANLLRQNRNLVKQENMMRVRVRRLESIRARQAEQIRELTEKERLGEIDRHQNRAARGVGGGNGSAVKVTRGPPATITPRQKREFLQRELLAMSAMSASSTVSRNHSENSDEDPVTPDEGARNSVDRARHWAWLRSMDDAKVIIRMCLAQLSDARAAAAATDARCTTSGPGVELERVVMNEKEESQMSPVELSKNGPPLGQGSVPAVTKEPLSQRSNGSCLERARSATTLTPVG